jgi:cytochrome b561
LSGDARPARWSASVIVLHWLSAALIIELVVHGWIMVHADLGAATTFDLYQWHKSLGFTVLALTAARFAARLALAAPATPVCALWERWLAALVQASLYLLTVAAILAGWLVVSTSPLPIPTRFFDLFVIPDIARPGAALFAGAVLAHKLFAWAIAALVALHVAGALKHHFVDRDDVLTRMLPMVDSDGSN